MVADYMPHNRSEQQQAYRAKKEKPIENDFGPRNPDGSMHQVPAKKSRLVRPS